MLRTLVSFMHKSCKEDSFFNWRNLGMVGCSLLSGAGEHLISLSDTGLEEVPVGHHLLDIIEGQVDQHTSDLGGLLRSEDLLDELIKHGTGLVLVVWILLDHGWDDHVAVLHELLVNGNLDWLLLDDLLWLHLLVHASHVSDHLSWDVHTTWHASHASLVSHVGVTIVGLVLVRDSTSHLSWASLASWTNLVVSVHHWPLWSEEGWETFQKQLQVVLDVLVVGESRPVGSLVVLGAEGLEVVLVLGSLVVDLSDLLNLIVVDGHGSSFEHLVVKLLLGGGGFIWLFEADKGV